MTGDKVQLLRTGRIWGDISAAALTTEEGAFIDGKITMAGHAANRPAADGEDGIHELAASDEVEIASVDEITMEADANPSQLELNETDPLESADVDGEDKNRGRHQG